MLAWRFLRLHRPIGGSSLGGCLCLGEIQNDENITNIREFQEAEYHAICVKFSAQRHPVAAQSAREPYALTSSNIAFSRARGGIRGLETAAHRSPCRGRYPAIPLQLRWAMTGSSEGKWWHQNARQTPCHGRLSVPTSTLHLSESSAIVESADFVLLHVFNTLAT
jgi:hypothetical protein